jgi:hypothetical protein
MSPSVVWWRRACHWTPRFAGSNPAEDDGFLRMIKIRSTISHVVDLRHIKEPYKHEKDVL